MLKYFRIFTLLWVLSFRGDFVVSNVTEQDFAEDSKREIGAGSEPNANETPKPYTTTSSTTITSTETTPPVLTSTTLEPNPFVRPTKILLTGAEPVEKPFHTQVPPLTTSTEPSHSKTTSTELPPQTPQITSTSIEPPSENVTTNLGMETNGTDVDVSNQTSESSTPEGPVSGMTTPAHGGVSSDVSFVPGTATLPGGIIVNGTNGNSGIPIGTGSTPQPGTAPVVPQSPESSASSVTTQGIPIGTGPTPQPGTAPVVPQSPASSASSVTTQGIPVGTGSTPQPGTAPVVSQSPVSSDSSVTIQGTGTGSTSQSINVSPGSSFTTLGNEGTTEACVDAVATCENFPSSMCNSTSPYYRYAQANCAATCGFCTAITTPHVCVDHIDNCNMYSEDLCVNSLYKKFVRDNCEAYCCSCGGCSPPTPSGPVTVAPTQDFTNVTTCNDVLDNCDYYDDDTCFGEYEPWARINCALRCYFCVGKTPSCVDYDPFCSMYDPTFCQQFSGWARTNCRETCKMCGPPVNNQVNTTGIPGVSGTPPAIGTGRPPVNPSAGTNGTISESRLPSYTIDGPPSDRPGYCEYTGEYISPQTPYVIPCDRTCRCVDATINRVICQEICPVWVSYPSNCNLQKQAGECCEQLICPGNGAIPATATPSP